MSLQPFLSRIEDFAVLPAESVARVRDLFGSPLSFAKDENVFVENTTQENFYVVTSGLFFASVGLPDATRQIHEIYYPGDIIGLDHISWSQSTANVTAAARGTLVPASIARTRRLMFRQPEISALFYSMHMLNNVLLLDRLTAVARLSAYNSLAYFLSDAMARRRTATETTGNRAILHLPLTQEFIADCLGLSSVHVSRQFRALESNGMIERIDRKTLRLLDVKRLQRICDYTDRYETLDRIAFQNIDRWNTARAFSKTRG